MHMERWRTKLCYGKPLWLFSRKVISGHVLFTSEDINERVNLELAVHNYLGASEKADDLVTPLSIP